MSVPGGRLYRNVAEQNDHLFATSRLERVFSSIQPLVANSHEIPFRSYARRFFPYRSNSHTSRSIGRNNLGRPSVSGIPRRPDNSASAQSLQVDQSHVVPSIDNVSAGVPNVVINIDLEPNTVSNEESPGSNAIENVGANDASGRMSPTPSDRNILGSLSIDTHNLEDFLGNNQDLRISFMNIWQYLLFICIVLVKLLFDKITSILVFVSLSFIFVMGDKVVRKKALNPQTSLKSIIAVIIIMPVSIYLLYTYNKENFFYSAILLFPDYELVTFGDLLWIIIITDLVLKVATVLVKAFVVLLPKSLLNQRSKSTIYELLERISRLYRSLATIQPWLSYFLDGYSGPRKIFGILLSSFYMLCKGPEIIVRIKELRRIISKFLFSGGYGSKPSQLELDEAGGKCPICHDEFTLPLRLECSHIFCESCVLMWFTRERTCPMCRTNIMSEEPVFRDGGTSYLPQIY